MSSSQSLVTTLDEYRRKKSFSRKRKRKTCSAITMTVSPQSNRPKRMNFKHMKMEGGNKSINCLVNASMTVVMMTLIGVMVLESTTGRASEVSALEMVPTGLRPLNSANNISETIIVNPTNLSAANWLPNRPSVTHRFRLSALPGE